MFATLPLLPSSTHSRSVTEQLDSFLQPLRIHPSIILPFFLLASRVPYLTLCVRIPSWASGRDNNKQREQSLGGNRIWIPSPAASFTKTRPPLSQSQSHPRSHALGLSQLERKLSHSPAPRIPAAYPPLFSSLSQCLPPLISPRPCPPCPPPHTLDFCH